MKSMASLHGDSLGAESDTLNMVGKPQRVTWKCWTWTSLSAVRERCHGGIGSCSESLNPGASACRQAVRGELQELTGNVATLDVATLDVATLDVATLDVATLDVATLDVAILGAAAVGTWQRSRSP